MTPEFPASSGKDLRLLITARHLPLYTGGLASYQKQLAVELAARDQVSAGFLAAEKGRETNPSALPGPSSILDCLRHQKTWMRLASRPLFHPLLQFWIESCFERCVKAHPVPQADVVHFIGTGWDLAGFGFHRLARMQGARFTVWPAVHPGGWGDDAIDLRLYRLADAVFCQSHNEAAHLQNLGLEASKIVHCGLPPMCLPGLDGRLLREKWNLGERPVVLFLGRRDEAKGYPALLKAWPQVLAQNSGALLVLSGPGGSEYESLLKTLPSGSFLDLGIADEETKAAALAACDIFCLPSAHESFGIVFAEAWSYGKPVICGPAPASREWIRNGQTGLHTDQTPGSIATAINRLLADKALRTALGTNGLDLQRSSLTWEAISKIHMHAFHTQNRAKES